MKRLVAVTLLAVSCAFALRGEGPRSLSVLTWNTMHYGWEQQPKAQADLRERVMIDQIRDCGCDVALIQETYGSFGRLLKGLPGWHGALLGACNCVLSRHPIVKTYAPYDDGLLYGCTNGYDYGASTKPFTFAVAEIAVGGRRVRVCPIAMNWQPYCVFFPTNLGAEAALAWEGAPQPNRGRPRPQAMRAILDSIAEMRREADAIPLIIGGDFNSQSHLDWTASTAGVPGHCGRVIPWQVSRIMADAGFCDTYRHLHPDPARDYGNSFAWLVPGRASSAITLRLDYIYSLGRGLRPVSSTLCNALYLSPYAFEGRSYPAFPSDHGFFLTRFEFANP